MGENIVHGKLDFLFVGVNKQVLTGVLREDGEDDNLVLTQPFPLKHPHLVNKGSFLIAAHVTPGVLETLEIVPGTFGFISSVGSSRCLFTTFHF